mgnify:CR=1 FL=1
MTKPATRNPIPLADRISLTVTETLAATGLSRTGFYALVASGELPTFTIGKRRYVSGDVLRAWVGSRTADAAIPSELSEKRAMAGRLGRAAQLAARAKTGGDA